MGKKKRRLENQEKIIISLWGQNNLLENKKDKFGEISTLGGYDIQSLDIG